MNFDILQYVLVFLIGALTGLINTIAAAGSLLTLPMLIFTGLPANAANATNRLGIFFQCLTSSYMFKKKEILDVRGGLTVSVPCIIGSLIGAYTAVDIDEALMKQIIGGIMLLVMIIMLVKPDQLIGGTSTTSERRLSLTSFLAYFIIGFYGGFIQAGVGIFLMIGLSAVSGYQALYANALKSFITLTLNIAALAIFIWSGLVDFRIGLMLSAGSVLGAWIGSKAALKGGVRLIRWALFVAIFFSAAKLLGLFDLFY